MRYLEDVWSYNNMADFMPIIEEVTTNSIISDGEIFRLRDEISKFTGDLPTGMKLLDEVAERMVLLWEENKIYKARLENAELENVVLRESIPINLVPDSVQCKHCKDYKEERIVYYMKYKACEKTVKELSEKYAAKKKLLKQLQKDGIKMEEDDVNEYSDGPGPSTRVKERRDNAKEPKSFVCTVDCCRKAFIQQIRFETHMESHATEKPLVCRFKGCKERFSKQGLLDRHSIKHLKVNGAYRCPEEGCGKAFNFANFLERHILKHKRGPQFVCPYDTCGRSFVCEEYLVEHIRLHSGEKPYPCGYKGCKRRFSNRSRLREHVFVHTGNS